MMKRGISACEKKHPNRRIGLDANCDTVGRGHAVGRFGALIGWSFRPTWPPRRGVRRLYFTQQLIMYTHASEARPHLASCRCASIVNAPTTLARRNPTLRALNRQPRQEQQQQQHPGGPALENERESGLGDGIEVDPFIGSELTGGLIPSSVFLWSIWQ